MRKDLYDMSNNVTINVKNTESPSQEGQRPKECLRS